MRSTLLHCLLLCLTLLGVAPACQRASEPAPESTTENAASEPEVLLRGNFTRVAKRATGSAELVRRGEQYQLRLRGASVDNLGEVHVYFVGLPDARSTAALTEAETKYDFGPLKQNAAEQLIDLPSEPAPELRSVVLYEPRYRINLAAAALRPAESPEG